MKFPGLEITDVSRFSVTETIAVCIKVLNYFILTHYFRMPRQFYTKLHEKSQNILRDNKWMSVAELKMHT